MRMNAYLIAALAPPAASCDRGCASQCAAPATVLWLSGLAGIVYGLIGGPTAEAGISWHSVGFGLALWGAAVVWTLAVRRDAPADCCTTRPARDQDEPTPTRGRDDEQVR